MAKAYGIKGYQLEKAKDLQTVLSSIVNDREAMVFDVNVIENENCYPMVAPGRSNSQMLGLEKQEKQETVV